MLKQIQDSRNFYSFVSLLSCIVAVAALVAVALLIWTESVMPEIGSKVEMVESLRTEFELVYYLEGWVKIAAIVTFHVAAFVMALLWVNKDDQPLNFLEKVMDRANGLVTKAFKEGGKIDLTCEEGTMRFTDDGSNHLPFRLHGNEGGFPLFSVTINDGLWNPYCGQVRFSIVADRRKAAEFERTGVLIEFLDGPFLHHPAGVIWLPEGSSQLAQTMANVYAAWLEVGCARPPMIVEAAVALAADGDPLGDLDDSPDADDPDHLNR